MGEVTRKSRSEIVSVYLAPFIVVFFFFAFLKGLLASPSEAHARTRNIFPPLLQNIQVDKLSVTETQESREL